MPPPRLTIFILACALSSLFARLRAEDRPPGATHCDLSIPIQIELVPVEEPQVGRPAQFQVHIESALDPDLVKNLWVEYDLPQGVRRIPSAAGTRQELRRSGHSRLDLGVIIPDDAPRRIRARLVVQLNDGRTISQTATKWINPDTRPPEGMTGRIANPDGTAIRIYQGVTVR